MNIRMISKLILIAICFFIIFACSESDDPVTDGDNDTESDETDLSPDGDNDTESAEYDLEDDAEFETSTDRAILSVYQNAIRLQWQDGNAELTLMPSIIVDDTFYGAGEHGDCTAEDNTVTCPAGDYGDVVANIENNAITLEFTAKQDVDIEGLFLTGKGLIPGADTWLSNGFQSWSQAGVLQIGDKIEYSEIKKALTAIPGVEVLRQGKEQSWFYTYIGGGEASLFAGVTTANTFKPWINVYKSSNNINMILGNGGAGESVNLKSGDSLSGETWYLDIRQNLEQLLTDYGKMLPTRRETNPHPAQIGWNSWYDLWYNINEDDILNNAPIAKSILDQYIPENEKARIVIDDGWQKKWGEWEPDDGFPLGLDGVAEQINSKGMDAGVWLAPLLVQPDSEIVTNHPDWFVGDNIPDNPDVFYAHEVHGKLLVLDVTHPEVVTHMKAFLSQIVGWGYSLLKIDFLFAGAIEGRRYNQVTGMQAYNLALKTIREGVGEETILLSVGCPPLPTSQYADAWRLGSDIAFVFTDDIVSWHFAVNQARSISARWFMCYSMLCDADPAILRVLSRNEVDFGAWVAALAGGFMFLSDDLPALDEERKSWGLTSTVMEAGLSTLPSIPENFYPDNPPEGLTNHMVDMVSQVNKHVLSDVWKTPNGKRIFFNFSNEETEFEGNNVEAHSIHISE